MDNYIDLPPAPASLIESLRDIGYSFQTAIADIVDNSITANASNIHIKCSWNSGDCWLAIVDDGLGMTHDELISAMRFGSKHPLEDRNLSDMGRFGLGMKTASFSQCRHLTVCSKKNNQLTCCEWDLELISKNNHTWKLCILEPTSINKRKVLKYIYDYYLETRTDGTIVLWEDIDRVSDQGLLVEKEKKFNSYIDDTRQHLELVFHRYLSAETGDKQVNIFINDDELIAFNPFNPNNSYTVELEEQQIPIYQEKIIVQPYILPHHSKVSREEYDLYAGEEGYLQNQGFYVYRNKRLIIKGTWFRLIKKEEINKLIRVRIDIPNTLDYLWKIDVKKSHATPPEIVRNELKQIIYKIEQKGHGVSLQKGTILRSKVNSPVWNRKAVGGTIVYQINRQHPLVLGVIQKTPADQKELLKNILSMIEYSFPVNMFFNDVASHPKQVERPSFDEKTIEMLLEVFIEEWKTTMPLNKILVEELLSTDPFASNMEVTKELLIKKGYSIHE